MAGHGEDAIAHPRREALDLAEDAIGHVDGGPVRHVAVGPQRVLAGRRARGIEEALLRDEHEGTIGVLAAPDGGLRGRDFGQRAAEVDGPRVCAFPRPPRDGAVEGGVDLEHSRTVAVALQAATIAAGQPLARDRHQLAGSQVE